MVELEQISTGIFMVLAVFVGSAVSPFLSAYFKSKANNLATKEDFQQILEQTKKTTTDVEHIRESISSKTWLNQQRWMMREKRYSELLGELEILRQSLHERLKHYNSQESLQDMGIPESKSFQAQNVIGADAFNAIREMIGPTAIFLPATIQKSLEGLVSAEYDLEYGVAGQYTYYNELATEVTKVYKRVLAQAREDLAAS